MNATWLRKRSRVEVEVGLRVRRDDARAARPAAGRRRSRPGRPPRRSTTSVRRCRAIAGVAGRSALAACRPRGAVTVGDVVMKGAERSPGSVSRQRHPGVSHEGRAPVATSTKSRLTGERPQQGVTPDSLLALHEAGYRAVLDRIGQGRILDVGCGQGFESARFLGAGPRGGRGRLLAPRPSPRPRPATAPTGLRVAQMDALGLGFAPASFDGGLLVAPHRALHRPRAPRRRAGPRAHGRRRRLRAHPEQAGRLREPVPPPPLRPGRAAGHARAPLRRRLARRGRRRAPREGRLRRPPGQGEQAAPARRVRPPAPHAALVVRLGVHAAAARRLQAGGPGGHRAAPPASPPTTGSSPTTSTTRRSSSSPWPAGPRRAAAG